MALAAAARRLSEVLWRGLDGRSLGRVLLAACFHASRCRASVAAFLASRGGLLPSAYRGVAQASALMCPEVTTGAARTVCACFGWPARRSRSRPIYGTTRRGIG
jgi:hypothetical protein